MNKDEYEIYEKASAEFNTNIVSGLETLTGRFVQAYVLVASCETAEGVESWHYKTLPGQSPDRSLGLLESAAASEKYMIVRTFPASGFLFDDDDDCDNPDHDHE